ncbi:MAG: caspase family protein [Bacteroidota bacterium]
MNKLILVICNILFFALSIHAQCISGDCINGKGTYVYPSGAKYTGEFSKGEIHGVGVCYYTDGSKYSGNWERRFPHGKGTKTFPDGTKWTGNWLKGQPVDENGQLVEIRIEEEVNDGTDIQSGCISGDCKEGEGVFAYADGSKFEGQFRSGRLDGWGTWYFPNGEKYIGAFKNNFMHGRGTLYAADGSKTSGDWVEGEYVGDGQSELGRVGCIKGDCANGQGTYVYQDAAAKYIGSFRNNVAHGRGICHYANGDRYEGDWVMGSFNGMGTLYLKDGTEVAGKWLDGTYMGPAEVPQAEETLAAVDTEDTPIIKDIAPDVRDMKVWALVVGISSYSHMPALRYTDDDAYRMYAFLKSPEGGALSDDQIRILIDEEATRQRIIDAMSEIFGQAGPNDLVMLYFSGHGLKGSFVPIDFDGFNNKLAHEEINAILAQSPAKYKLCIADACHSGSLFAMKGTYETALTKYYKTLAQAQAGTALIMSSKSDETSLESSGLRQGVFSHFLIRGLKGEADMDHDRVVSVQELYDYIHDNVRAYTGLRQSPVIKGDYDPKMTVGVLR